MSLLKNMARFLGIRRPPEDPEDIQLLQERVTLRQEQRTERQLMRLARSEYIDTLMKGVVQDIRRGG